MTKAKETTTTRRTVTTDADTDTDAVKFVYRGPDGETETDQFGYQFRDGKPVTVSDARAIEKLRNNPYFEEQGAKRGKRRDEDDEDRPAVVDAGINPEPHEPTGIIYGGSGT